MSSWEKMKVFFGFSDDDVVEENNPEMVKLPAVKSFKGNVSANQGAQKFSSSEIKVEEPRVYEDSLSIAMHLRDNKPCIVNLKYLDSESGKRLIDFICGTAYAINGHMLKIGENIFLFTPADVLISDSTEKTTLQQGVEQEEKEVFFNRAIDF